MIYFLVSIATISYMIYKCIWKHKSDVKRKDSPNDINHMSDDNNIDKEDLKFRDTCKLPWHNVT